jgi:lipopolysaccharide/colanic/teichoic acid biosynthesis glycosyltransferase
MRGAEIGKRTFDVVAGGALCLLALPVIVISAAGAAISLRAWPFFTQERVGRDGRIFRFVKLRTLPVHTPPYAGKYELGHLDVPAFCKLLRLLHLDELPQLYLVVLGWMSLVGPRPEMPYLHEQLDPAFAAYRTSVRPGCTGLWQISDHCHEMIFEHPEFDEHYLRNRSLRLDAWILGRTLRLMIPVHDKRLVSLGEIAEWVDISAPSEERPAEKVLQSVEA